MISNLSYLPLLGKSDHLYPYSILSIILTTPNDNLEYTRFNLNAGDYNSLRAQVASIDCEGMLNMTMDEAWNISMLHLMQLSKVLFHYLVEDPSLGMFIQPEKFFD